MYTEKFHCLLESFCNKGRKGIRKRGEAEIVSKFPLPLPPTQPPVYEEIKSQRFVSLARKVT